MEWAIGVGRDLRGPHILIEDSKRRVSQIALECAVSKGLPTVGNKKLVTTLDLNTHQSADPEEYVRAFGFEAGITRSSHSVFRFLTSEVSQHTHQVSELVIPSLVLIRAVFRPSRFMLPALFRPQALDQVRFIEPTDGLPRIQLLASWANSSVSKYGDVLGPLAWMSFFPSAAAMASSVFALAAEGTLGIQLPLATARLSVSGISVGETLYVTKLKMIEVTAGEQAVQGAERCSTKVVYHAVAKTYGGKHRVVRLPPKKADGCIDVSDDEWKIIGPILIGRTPARRFKLDQRKIFDGVLRKLSESTGWKAATYTTGAKENALHAWRTWSKSGRWDAAMAQLEMLRHINGPA